MDGSSIMFDDSLIYGKDFDSEGYTFDDEGIPSGSDVVSSESSEMCRSNSSIGIYDYESYNPRTLIRDGFTIVYPNVQYPLKTVGIKIQLM